MSGNEAVLVADAMPPTHPEHAGGRQEKLAIKQTSGRQRINIHGEIDFYDWPDPDDRGQNRFGPTAKCALLAAI